MRYGLGRRLGQSAKRSAPHYSRISRGAVMTIPINPTKFFHFVYLLQSGGRASPLREIPLLNPTGKACAAQRCRKNSNRKEVKASKQHEISQYE